MVNVIEWIFAERWHIVAMCYFIASVLTFVIYRHDKLAAKSGKWRTPEATLHLFELSGGWPGAFLAQRWLHHKNRKQSYQTVFWCIVCLNIVGVAYFWNDIYQGTRHDPHAPVRSARKATRRIPKYPLENMKPYRQEASGSWTDSDCGQSKVTIELVKPRKKTVRQVSPP